MIDVKSILSLGLAAVLISAGVTAHNTLSAKTRAQLQVNEGVMRYQNSYMALSESMKKWDASYSSASQINDLMALNAILNLPHYGLIADPDKTKLSKVDAVANASGTALGMTKICLTNSGNSDFVVTAPDFPTLFAGVKRLSRRLDVSIGFMSFSGEKDASAKITDFCILVRN